MENDSGEHYRVIAKHLLSQSILAGAASGKDTGKPMFRLRVYNLAVVSPDVLARAREELLAIFERAGIAVEWLDLSSSPPATDRTSNGRTLHIRMIIRAHCAAQPHPTRSFVIGRLLGSDDAGGTVAACYDEILRVARNHRQPSADVLALTMAHEIGHVLLPAPSHAPSGIMHSDWTPWEIRRLSAGTLRFTSSEVTLLWMKLAGSGMGPVR